MGRNDELEDRYVVVEKSTSGIGTFLFGLALGAGAALLLAPKAGEETRRMLRDQARTAGDRAKKAFDEMASSVQDTMMDVRSDLSDRMGEVRHSVRRRRRQMEHAVDAGKSAAHEARRELERKLAEFRTEEEDRMARAAREATRSASRDARAMRDNAMDEDEPA